MRELAETLAYRAGVYRPARDLYDRLFRPARLVARARSLEFFRQFVAPGDLVFDAGAHEGRFTDLFVELGASVVAIEPMPDFARQIVRRHGSSVSVENVAVGAREARADLLIGRLTVHSSLAPRWIQVVHDAGGDRWTDKISVEVVPLDQLIERHGVPDFVKIDVEGYEPEVFAGLSRPLRLMSFEAQSRAPALARECIERLSALGDYEFNLVPGVEMELVLDSWVEAHTIVDELERLDQRNVGTGDVYARLRTG